MAEGKFRFSLRQLFLLMTLACLAFFFVPKVATLVLLTMAWGLGVFVCSSLVCVWIEQRGGHSRTAGALTAGGYSLAYSMLVMIVCQRIAEFDIAREFEWVLGSFVLIAPISLVWLMPLKAEMEFRRRQEQRLRRHAEQFRLPPDFESDDAGPRE